MLDCEPGPDRRPPVTARLKPVPEPDRSGYTPDDWRRPFRFDIDVGNFPE